MEHEAFSFAMLSVGNDPQMSQAIIWRNISKKVHVPGSISDLNQNPCSSAHVSLFNDLWIECWGPEHCLSHVIPISSGKCVWVTLGLSLYRREISVSCDFRDSHLPSINGEVQRGSLLDWRLHSLLGVKLAAQPRDFSLDLRFPRWALKHPMVLQWTHTGLVGCLKCSVSSRITAMLYICQTRCELLAWDSSISVLGQAQTF